MARIAFILLCHKDPEAIVRQAERLTATGDFTAIHFDRRAPTGDYQRIRRALEGNENVVFARNRVKCGWGEWSLVQATMNAAEAALEAFPEATHFHMISGDCMAIKSAEFAHELLDRADCDHIESHDYFDSGWIKTGFREERLIYRHWFNERSQKRLFYAATDLQRRLGLTRQPPADLDIRVGSQWWCLRRHTLGAVLDFARQRRDVVRFFRTTWIPDETFFQTIVRHLVPDEEIRNRSLTFLMFTDYGMPATFYNDHYDLLLSQDYLFARKISPEAEELKRRLGTLWAARGVHFAISDEGPRLHAFLTGQGRIGRRFGMRFWETESSLGRDRELMIVICKKWTVAKRLVAAIRKATGLPAVDYLFDEEATPLPALGGIESSLEKRTRHRRALVRMLFDFYQGDRLVICLDPRGLDLLRDFCSDRALVRLLLVDCHFSDAQAIAHARRIGLAGAATPPEALDRLVPTLRNDMASEVDRLHDAGFARFGTLREGAPPEANAEALAAFLSIPKDAARKIAESRDLFAD
ncbi:DUF5928 domain-containing protein [Pseudooceanicola sp. LIPI14-2-Ac024]|uniref:DUF5928 domain-containing protein n=1 Tax=Pseudooceanicola sp. LIPI14-2-Ac024 TaxID=3344875 RepID=UPI0035D031FA